MRFQLVCSYLQPSWRYKFLYIFWLSRRQQKMKFFALQSRRIATESRQIATELHCRDAVAIRRDENVVVTVKTDVKSDRSQFVSVRFERKLHCQNRSNFLHFFIHLVFFLKKKNFCMGKYEFPKKEIFFWSILVTEATKMIARFL